MENMEIRIIEKKIKNMYIHVYPNGEVHVHVPKGVKKQTLSRFLEAKKEWMMQTRQKLLNRPKPARIEYKEGAKVLILGQSYTLRIIQGKKRSAMIHGDFLEVMTRPEDDERKIYETIGKGMCPMFLRAIEEDIRKYTELLHVPVPAFAVRDMRSRYGSCNIKNRKIHISRMLLHAPRECLAYVVAHEVAHLSVPNHSKRFYAVLEGIYPDWQREKKNLRMVSIFFDKA